MQRSCNVKNTINAVRCKGVHYVPPGCVLVTGFTPLYIHTTPEYRYFIQQKINCKNTKHWFFLHPRPVIPTNADMKKFTKVPSYFILPGFVFFLLRINSFQGSYVNVGPPWGENSFDWGCKEIPRTVLYILLLAMSLQKLSTGQLSETYILTGSVISMYLQLSNNSSNGRKKNQPWW